MKRFSGCLFIFMMLIMPAWSQSNFEVFGKNRIQYRTFDWKFYESNRFRVYYYDRGGRELAKFVAEQAEQDVRAIERNMNGNFPKTLNIILYNSYDDYLQSNIGLDQDLQSFDLTGNVDIIGDKLVVYYSGKHVDLKNQMRRGMAKVIIERAMFGDDIKSFTRNALAQSIAPWTVDGYIDYLVFGWDTDTEEDWKQLLKQDKVYFNDLLRTHPEIAGRAFWKFIAEKNGDQAVKNLFYAVLVRNNLNKALRSSYDISEKEVYQQIIQFFNERYKFEKELSEDPNSEAPLFVIDKPTKETIITNILVSPRGKDIAYVAWEHGQYQVILERTDGVKGKESRTKAVLLRGGEKDHTATPDPEYPILNWSNTGFKLAMAYKQGNAIKIKLYDAIKGKMSSYTVRKNRFDRILDFTFMEDDEVIIVSGVRNGQSDLFEYRLKNGRTLQLTNDVFDDLSPSFVSGGARKGIAFISNRPQPYLNLKALPNELPTGSMNAYFYNHTTKSDSLMQLTDNDYDLISDIIPFGPDYFSYLSYESGIRNRYIVLFERDQNNLDTAYSIPITNYSSNIISQQYNPASGNIAEVIQDGDAYKVYFRPVALKNEDGSNRFKEPMKIEQIDISGQKRLYENYNEPQSNQKIDIRSGDYFQSEFYPSNTLQDTLEGNNEIVLKKESIAFANELDITAADSSQFNPSVNYVIANDSAEGKRILYVDSTFIKLRSHTYRHTFLTSSFTARLDKSFIFNRYQSYNGGFGGFSNQNMGSMLFLSLKDRMEDHRITGGVKLNSDLSASLLLKYQNLRRRLDWGVAVFNQAIKSSVYVNAGNLLFYVPTKEKLLMLQGDVAYPLNRTNSIRSYLSLRADKTVLKADNILGLVVPDINEYFVMNRVEFVHDDTRNMAPNILNGFRYKGFAEYLYKLYSDNDNFIDENGRVNNQTGGFYNFGFDLRYYYPIYKNFIFAIRTAGAHSGGSHQIMYRMGGVDDEIAPQYNSLLNPSIKNNYAFQTLATNLRGYKQNARNGNTYALINAELRLPLISTFINRPINSKFLKNLQLVSFVDMGSAWEGLLPNHQEDRMNRFYYPDIFNPSVVITVPYPNPNGLALGYGAGLRFFVYSYFLRLDYARNIQNDDMIHLSLGLDF